jgi:uncharacterized oxidoreductase
MKLTGNTIFITGGGSGIGRALAESLHKNGNQIIIAGRRREVLEEVIQANPGGMKAIELDMEDPARIEHVAKTIIADFPAVNVLINNAGIMKGDNVGGVVDDAVLTSTIGTNLTGLIRMSSAFVEHLKQQPSATIINVTSGLAFTPLALNAIYCATKAAVHSYTYSLRYKLKDTSVRVLEVAPPYVQTELTGARQKNDPMAMPLEDYIKETLQLLETDADEILVERVKRQRNNPGPNEAVFLDEFNAMLAKARAS